MSHPQSRPYMRRASGVILGIFLIVGAGADARADVIYTVLNPSAHFTLFVYDSPAFITTDTMVDVAQLAFANPLNSITEVEFIPSFLTFQGTSEVDILQSAAPNQFRYYPQGTFTQFGTTPGDSNSFGFPNSELSVAPAPEPPSSVLLLGGLLGFGLIRCMGLLKGAAARV
jgi:hypothetical protein